jgi:hypothetical protein
MMDCRLDPGNDQFDTVALSTAHPPLVSGRNFGTF